MKTQSKIYLIFVITLSYFYSYSQNNFKRNIEIESNQSETESKIKIISEDSLVILKPIEIGRNGKSYIRAYYPFKVHYTGVIIAYPNPATNNITVTPPSNGGKAFMVEVFDNAGRQIISQPLGIDNKLDISALAGGAYIIRLKNDKGTYQTKLLVAGR